MRILLDTHVMLALVRGDVGKRYPAIAGLLTAPRSFTYVSAVSLWETAIKTRLKKLDPGMALEHIAGYLEATGVSIIAIETSHVIAQADPEPETRDPFDRLLLAQCQVEGLQLATVDRKLADHRLAVRA